MPELTFAQSVNKALSRSLEQWPEALLYGEDVGTPGGVFGVTKGLQKHFGDRVFDTPISEAAILGSAVGASMFGARPIVEIMWLDFMMVAFDQVVNQASNVRYVSNGRLTAPMTIRTQAGSAPGACAQHSQNLEAFLAHVPGIRIGMPSTPQDAYDMLLTAVAEDDPVVIIENRSLYHSLKEDVVLDGDIQPLGGSHTIRHGQQATVVTWGSTRQRVLEAADVLAGEGIDLEVIDLRWLRPYDDDAVIRSVERTGALAVVHDAHVTAGFGAEVVAKLAESDVSMSRPPLRVGAPDARIPAAPSLLAQVIPQSQGIADSLRNWLDRETRA